MADETVIRAKVEEIFEGLARGERRPFADAMADDFCWTISGSSTWSRRFEGKDVVRSSLIDPLFTQFETEYTNTARRILVDGEYAVVECSGRARTADGKDYNNDYCFVIRMRDGKMVELTEYADTALMESALRPLP